MPKANELDLIPADQQLPDRILVIADPATGQLYKIPASLLAAIIGAGRFGVEDNTSDADRLFNLNDKTLDIVAGTPDFSGQTTDFFQDKNTISLFSSAGNGQERSNGQITSSGINFAYSKPTANGQRASNFGVDEGSANMAVQDDNNVASVFEVKSDEFTFRRNNPALGDAKELKVPLIVSNNFLPLSINGHFADATGNITLIDTANNYPDDAAAAASGLVPLSGFYHTNGVVKIRLT